MTWKELDGITGGLSKPSKMPGYAYGLPARECIIGSKLREVEGSVCHGCYAMKGMYVFPVVQRAQYRRLHAIEDAKWVDAMAESISRRTRKGEKYFRWHDSGDLQSVQHLSNIVRVVERLPDVSHWLPTREYAIVRQWLKLHGRFPSNLVVRLSAHMVDGPAPAIEGTAQSRVRSTKKVVDNSNPLSILGAQTEDGWRCPAPKQNNECGSCRACWSSDVECVTYAKH